MPKYPKPARPHPTPVGSFTPGPSGKGSAFTGGKQDQKHGGGMFDKRPPGHKSPPPDHVNKKVSNF